MTIVVKASDWDAIYIPAWLMKALGLHEGDQVKAIVNGKTLHLARVNRFLNLRGALADDEDFDNAITFIDRAWQSWALPLSV
jgi:antitoxin component of MazEF toxin-antitoxin module